MSHTRIKIGLGEVLDKRGKGEVVKWMREIKTLRKIHKRRIGRERESVSVVKRNCKPNSLAVGPSNKDVLYYSIYLLFIFYILSF